MHISLHEKIVSCKMKIVQFVPNIQPLGIVKVLLIVMPVVFSLKQDVKKLGEKQGGEHALLSDPPHSG